MEISLHAVRYRATEAKSLPKNLQDSLAFQRQSMVQRFLETSNFTLKSSKVQAAFYGCTSIYSHSTLIPCFMYRISVPPPAMLGDRRPVQGNPGYMGLHLGSCHVDKCLLFVNSCCHIIQILTGRMQSLTCYPTSYSDETHWNVIYQYSSTLAQHNLQLT